MNTIAHARSWEEWEYVSHSSSSSSSSPSSVDFDEEPGYAFNNYGVSGFDIDGDNLSDANDSTLLLDDNKKDSRCEMVRRIHVSI